MRSPAMATDRVVASTRVWAQTISAASRVETAATPSAAPPARTATGWTSRRTASRPISTAEANTSAACSRLAKASALPWP